MNLKCDNCFVKVRNQNKSNLIKKRQNGLQKQFAVSKWTTGCRTFRRCSLFVPRIFFTPTFMFRHSNIILPNTASRYFVIVFPFIVDLTLQIFEVRICESGFSSPPAWIRKNLEIASPYF
jgi:hypothetical protein